MPTDYHAIAGRTRRLLVVAPMTVGHALAAILLYSLFYAFAMFCVLVVPVIYVAVLAVAWAAEKTGERVADWRARPRGGWKFDEYDLGGRE